MGNHSLWGKNSALYDDVLRVPLLVHKPGQTGSRTIDTRVCSTEVFPTLLEAGGCSIPKICDGDTLENMTAKGGRDVIISTCEGRLALIKGDWKLCLNGVGCELQADAKIYKEMYNLNEDPYEYTNLYYDEKYRDIREELEATAEAEPDLMRTVFWKRGDAPYWFNAGEGSGYEFNGMKSVK